MFTPIAAITLALAVILGAFGAHGLKDLLAEYANVWEKAVFYHFVHGLAVLVVSLLPALGRITEAQSTKICLLFLAGIFFFSGSLYLLSLTKLKWLGAVTPLGGTAFIVAWIWLAAMLISQPKPQQYL